MVGMGLGTQHSVEEATDHPGLVSGRQTTIITSDCYSFRFTGFDQHLEIFLQKIKIPSVRVQLDKTKKLI